MALLRVFGGDELGGTWLEVGPTRSISDSFDLRAETLCLTHVQLVSVVGKHIDAGAVELVGLTPRECDRTGQLPLEPIFTVLAGQSLGRDGALALRGTATPALSQPRQGKEVDRDRRADKDG